MKVPYFQKILFSCILIFMSSLCSAQLAGRYGFKIGATEYTPGANQLIGKSSTGYSLGVLGTAPLSRRQEIIFEINYTQNYVSFLGRGNETAQPENIKFSLQNLNIPIVLNYSPINFENTFYIGAEVGAAASIFYNYRLVDESQKNYLLETENITPYELMMDDRNEVVSLNGFFVFGLAAEYKQFMLNFRYYHGFTNPYRSQNSYSPTVDLDGKDKYFALSIIYFTQGKW